MRISINHRVDEHHLKAVALLTKANNGDMLNSVEMTSSGDSLMGSSEVDARKLVILGLPWDTTVSSLEQYFSQIGPLQVCSSIQPALLIAY